MAEPPCIFCFNSTDFTREHVIAEAIGGSLFLDNAVCKKCNSRLGANVDVELVKLPETIDAFEALGIAYDRDKMLNRHWKVVGSARGLEFNGHLTTDGFQFHPQILADESMVFPDVHQALEALRKSGTREAAGTPEEIDAELARLQEAYDASAPNEQIQSTFLGRTIVERSDALDIQIKPRDKARLTPVMAKIAYEFLFLMAGGRRLLAPENRQAVNALFDLIEGRSSDGGERCVRRASPTKGFDDAHYIRFHWGPGSCTFQIILFGNVHHLLITPFFSESILDEVKTVAKQDVIGAVYLQRITTGAKVFRAVTPDGQTIHLPVD